MLPEGTMWLYGSRIGSAAAEHLEADRYQGDSVTDQRSKSGSSGQTLTGCANDLYGPCRDPTGDDYWTKVAFAQETLRAYARARAHRAAPTMF